MAEIRDLGLNRELNFNALGLYRTHSFGCFGLTAFWNYTARCSGRASQEALPFPHPDLSALSAFLVADPRKIDSHWGQSRHPSKPRQTAVPLEPDIVECGRVS